MKKITKLGMAAAVLFCVVGLGSHTQAAMAAEETTIENGISIGNVNVGGMTENQAISAVEEYVDGLMDTTFYAERRNRFHSDDCGRYGSDRGCGYCRAGSFGGGTRRKSDQPV